MPAGRPHAIAPQARRHRPLPTRPPMPRSPTARPRVPLRYTARPVGLARPGGRPASPAPYSASAAAPAFLLCGLLVLPLLAGAGRLPDPRFRPGSSVRDGRLIATPPASFLCDPSAAGSGSCAGQPFHAAVASVPASLSPRPSAARSRHRHATPSPSAVRVGRHRTLVHGAHVHAPPASATSPAGTSSGSAAAQVLALINQARSAAGLAPLTITAGLNSSASAHNSRMAGGCGLSHQCPGEPDLGARETAAGVALDRGRGEHRRRRPGRGHHRGHRPDGGRPHPVHAQREAARRRSPPEYSQQFLHPHRHRRLP